MKNSSIAFEKRTGEIEIIQLDEIVYFSTGNSHECEVKLIDSTNITLNKALSHYRKTFIEEGNFFPINRSIILNLSYINTFNPQKQIIRLTTGEELSISRRQASKLRHLLLRTEEDNDQHIG
ncbi:LytTR family DNA-binding domain-containing protein [Porphyromonas levii]|uniref:LytTR family DNA-binding domain-containing protein n=1 Tax=Porphyromonas levii TaxID=28114 RepID=UPI001070DD68|nr:LytTR family transcriptional regulator [Porphyromonas levii]